MRIAVLSAVALPAIAAPQSPYRTVTPLSAAELAIARAAFLPRYATLDAGRDDTAEPYTAEEAAALARYPLAPWLPALRLRNALGADVPGALEQAAGFLQTNDPTGTAGYARDLRRAVLRRLAERRDWASLVTLYREPQANDEARCLLAQARLALADTPGLANELGARWVAADGDLPAACNGPLEWLKAERTDLVEQRLRARLLDGDANRAAPLLPWVTDAPARSAYTAWVRLLQGGVARGFADLATGARLGPLPPPEGLGDTFVRHARAQTDTATEQLETIVALQRLPGDTAARLRAALALVHSWSRDPRALALYRQVPARVLDDRGHEWRVRAALWGGDFPTAVRWLREMPPALAAQQRWRYWLGRSLLDSGSGAEGVMVLTRLSQEFDAFGLFAAWRLGQPYVPADRPIPYGAAVQAALAESPAVQRAGEAWAAGLGNVASVEWRGALASLPDALKPALVPLARDWGWYAQAITTGTELRIFDDARALFPRPYESLVRPAAADARVPEEWVYGVMRRESAFRRDAVSGAGAVGLLQMLPPTAAITARRNGIPAPGRAGLLQPATNVPLGALHLREVLDRFGGSWPFALSAYNAGPGVLKRWLPPEPMAADVWIENIPFNETRSYVQRILLHAAVYQWLATGRGVRADAWLPVVQPQLP